MPEQSFLYREIHQQPDVLRTLLAEERETTARLAAAIRERSREPAVVRMVEMLVDQVLEIMPELADVTPWHSVGQRRTGEELGRAARTVVSEELLRQSNRP